MEPTKPKLPSEAIELYNLFIHGEISRRDFMDGVQRFADRRSGGGDDHRSVDAELRSGRSRCPRPMTGSRPPTRPSRRRKGTEASKDISSGPSAPTRETRRRRNCPALSSSTKIAA